MVKIIEKENNFIVVNAKGKQLWTSTKRINCERFITRILGKTINCGKDW